MATGRFVGDKLAEKFSRKKMVQASGVLIFCRMMIAVLFPYLIIATIEFLIVGFGINTIIPLLYSTVDKSAVEPKGIAIATFSALVFWGFLKGLLSQDIFYNFHRMFSWVFYKQAVGIHPTTNYSGKIDTLNIGLMCIFIINRCTVFIIT